MRILYSRDFEEDLRSIIDYISDKLQNRKAADDLLKRIFEDTSRLKESPYIGIPLSSLFQTSNSWQYRRIVVGNYIVIYRFSSDVIVERVFYGRRDYIKYLFSEDENDVL
ncbi:MAG TPA: type II toxin-antitoxin system mRNA interferase toxin, RelE/StbE family [Sphaerochaeta sp.]|jgi:addiction module RelE/StbE family toxin|nr:type II toxin-antitoxin system mRNA interferase toxin, RelE/StbE family [Sphaerochaeta sp.]